MQRICVEAPASIANLGPGFDALALAIDWPRDYIKVELKDFGEDEVQFLGPYGLKLKFEETSIAPVVEKFREITGKSFKVRVEILKNIRPASGLGSSGADAAGVAYALNELLGLRLGIFELVEIAAEGEKVAAGVPHMDNVAASLLGGLIIINPKLKIVSKAPIKRDFIIVVVVTGDKRSTEEMRKVLPQSIGLRSFVNDMSCVALLVKGLLEGDLDLVGKAIMCDEIVEPARARLYGHYDIVKEVLLELGAKGVALSGAGPSLFAVFDKTPDRKALEDALSRRDLSYFEVIITKPRSEGVVKSPAC